MVCGIYAGLSTEQIQYCFWKGTHIEFLPREIRKYLGRILFCSVIETDKHLTFLIAGFVCVRGFEQKTRAPRPLMARLHFPASKLKNNKT